VPLTKQLQTLAKIGTILHQHLNQLALCVLAMASILLFMYFPLRILALAVGCLGAIMGVWQMWSIATGRKSTLFVDINRSTRPIRQKAQLGGGFWPLLKKVFSYAWYVVSSVYYLNKCRHLRDCDCDAKARQNSEASLKDSNEEVQRLQGTLHQMQEQNTLLVETVADYERRRPNRTPSSPAMWWDRNDTRATAPPPTTSVPLQSPGSATFRDRHTPEITHRG
jgi:hypothetical protein